MTQSTLFKKTLLATLVPVLAMSSHAATVRSDVDYQTFRDFAENKGDFTVGATNVEVKDTVGNSLGTVLNGVPMPDFSSSDRLTGTVTLIDPQYAVSVAHNIEPNDPEDHFYSHQFGGQGFNPDAHHYNYAVVDTNDDPLFATQDGKHDYTVPRLAKLVTEVAPIEAATVGPLADYQAGSDRYAAFVRVGSGTQGILDENGSVLDIYHDFTGYEDVCSRGTVTGCTNVDTAYQYLVGGETLPYVRVTDGVLLSGGNDANGKPSNLRHSPLGHNEEAGDSGSPVYGYNKQTGKWELVAVLGGSVLETSNTGVEETLSYAIAARPDFNAQRIAEDEMAVHGSNYRWTQSGRVGTLTGTDSVTMGLSTDAAAPNARGYEMLMSELDNGDTLHFHSSGTLTLGTDINQGAGALYFNENFTVKGQTGAETHLGAGVVVADGKTVTWQVHNPEGDRLSKLGAGTLLVNGGGNNKGDISVGDGTVILNQQGGQAFNQVGIVSGRGTVVLQGENQVAADNIYFGYKGGRLDTHGKDLTFSYIQNVDEGAHIVNNNAADTTNITITGRTPVEVFSMRALPYEGGVYMLRGDEQGTSRGQVYHTPTIGKNDINYVYVGTDTASSTERINAYENHINAHNARAAFHGFLGEKDASRPNGNLNVTFSPNNRTNEQLLMLTGGSNLNGELSATAGTLLLSGRPVSYAANMQTKEEVVKDDKWHNASFVASAFKASGDAKLYAGRNVDKVQGNIALSDNARATLGFIKGETPICVRSEYHGEVQCDTTITEAGLASLGRTAVSGNVTMTGNSSLTLGKADLQGKATADRTTTMNLSPEARWVMTEDSTVGNLVMQDGSAVTLSNASNNFNTLTVGGNLSGKGRFNYNTEAGSLKGDKVLVQGAASGDFKLFVKDTGVEPTHSDDLVLMKVQNAQNLAVSLANAGQTVDVGALKYTLKTDDGLTYYLDNPFVPPVTPTPVTPTPVTPTPVTPTPVTPTPVTPTPVTPTPVTPTPVTPTPVTPTPVTPTPVTPTPVTPTPVTPTPVTPTPVTPTPVTPTPVTPTPVTPTPVTPTPVTPTPVTPTPVTPTPVTPTPVTPTPVTPTPVTPTPVTPTPVTPTPVTPTPVTPTPVTPTPVTPTPVTPTPVTPTPVTPTPVTPTPVTPTPVTPTPVTPTPVTPTPVTPTPVTPTPVTPTPVTPTPVTPTPVTPTPVTPTPVTPTPVTPTPVTPTPVTPTPVTPTPVTTQSRFTSRYTNAALSDLSSQVYGMMMAGYGLDSHLQNIAGDEHGSRADGIYLPDGKGSHFWVRGTHSESTHRSDNHREYTREGDLYQIGADSSVNVGNGTLTLGGAWAYGDTNNTFSEGITGESQLRLASLYGKLRSANDAFVTFDVGAGRSSTDMLSAGEKVQVSRDIAAAGLNVGKRFSTPVLDITPSVGARHYRLSDSNYTLNGANVRIDDTDVTSYRAGIALEKQFTLANGVSLVPSLGSYYVDTKGSDATVSVNNRLFDQSFGRTYHHELGLRLDGKAFDAGVAVSQSDGDEMDEVRSVAVTLGYKW